VAPRFLVDENLAARLVALLDPEYPGSEHVLAVLGACPSDEQIWEYARLQGLVIVTKDEDFQRFSVWRGFPPKVVWIQLGSCSTKQVADLLRASRAHIDEFVAHPDAAFLPLRGRDA
jgi:predicted nuclease of predicted toxin-antitoxin system